METEVKNIVQYGIGLDYLRKWGVIQALREVFQNYIDYGKYTVKEFPEGDTVKIIISNDYKPENLMFLKVGTSDKGNNQDAIGKYGEGLKMAFLVALREDFTINIKTNKYFIKPVIFKDNELGDCLAVDYGYRLGTPDALFTTTIRCDRAIWNTFKEGILEAKDKLFSDPYHGDIVDKEAGNIYVGGLYVCKLTNFKKAYNFPPLRIPLDRDREMPRTFDVNWHASKIQEAQGHLNATDTTYDDTQYVEKLPEKVYKQVTPRIVGTSVEFTTKDDKGEDVVITNSSVKEQLKRSNFFKDIIQKLKMSLIKGLGLYDLLLQFKEKHVRGSEMEQDFEMILNQVKTND